MVQRLSGGVVRPPQSRTDCWVLTQTFQAVSETRMKANRNWRARLCIAAACGVTRVPMIRKGPGVGCSPTYSAFLHECGRDSAMIWRSGGMNAQADRLRHRQPAQGITQPKARDRARQARTHGLHVQGATDRGSAAL